VKSNQKGYINADGLGFVLLVVFGIFGWLSIEFFIFMWSLIKPIIHAWTA